MSRVRRTARIVVTTVTALALALSSSMLAPAVLHADQPASKQTTAADPYLVTTEDLLKDFLALVGAARGGREPAPKARNAFIAQLVFTAQTSSWANAFDGFGDQSEMLAVLHRPTSAELKLRYVYPWVPALASIVNAVCRDDACWRSGFRMLARWKGLAPELLAPRPITLLPSDDAARRRARITGGSDANIRALTEKLGSPEAFKAKSPTERQAVIDALTKSPEFEKLLKGVTEFEEDKDSDGDGWEDRLETVGEDDEDRPLLPHLASLASDEVFVDIYRYRPRGQGKFTEEYLALVATRSSMQIVRLGSAATIDEVARALFDRLQVGEDTRAQEALLVTRLLDPIHQAIASEASTDARVWISPDAMLASLPWPALAMRARWEAPLTMVISAFDITRLREKVTPTATASKRPPSLLLVGDLRYASQGYPALPGTRGELAALAKLARSSGQTVTTLTQDAADRRALTAALTGAPGGAPRVAHLATHGIIAPDSAGGTFSFGVATLALSGASPTNPATVFTADDLRALDLSGIGLITLSACHTGQGRWTAGQGMWGFQTALMATGARSALLSLWNVPDQVTAPLMETFYRGLWIDGLGKAEALRRAQARIRAMPGYGDLRFWGGWTLVGEGW